MNNIFNIGFTLIELLVTIAIIGIIIAVVFVNLQGLQNKARDSNIKTFMHDLRNAAQLSYNQTGSYEFVCADDNTLSDTGDFGNLEQALEKENPGHSVTCFDEEQTFAVSFPLAASDKHWCVEAAGTGMEISNPITSAKCQ